MIHDPVRMCISCRDRIIQKKLIRFRINENRLIKNGSIGRSLYLCENCLKNDKNYKKIINIIQNRYKIKELNTIKEILD